ncbi:monofunctional biosynthetic peptidoglycan transglycosylase [gut metagenome]|uniref:Monofunctional biosynthetic peptidoglycan transglycosylase n=1 Tax=gut metagenome TaxID=749906 RepID=J9D6J6_9ZZZZ
MRRTDCARIAATLPNPLRMSSAAPSRYVKRRTRQILRQMRHLSPFPIAKDR